MSFIQPLDLWTLLVNNLAGNMFIFIAIAGIVIAGMAARFRMNNITLWVFYAVFAIMIGAWAGWLYALMLLIGGLAVGFIISKLIKQ